MGIANNALPSPVLQSKIDGSALPSTPYSCSRYPLPSTGPDLTEGTGENSKLGPYLAGLIEGDGTFAIHNNNSTAKKYRPKIIIVFKLADLPLAEYLQELTNCALCQGGYTRKRLNLVPTVYIARIASFFGC